jgi:DNA-binding response OmpR family regulator
METNIIAVLFIEDNSDDVVFIKRHLAGSPRVAYKVTHLDRLADGLEILNTFRFDVILLDLGLPDGPVGIQTFEKAYAHAGAIPIIVLTGNDDDQIAIESVQKGAQDYIVKGQVTGNMLGRAIRYAIERKKLLIQLEHSTREINKLRGILPICANCKKIRDDKGYWTQVETYIGDHTGTEFTHGICPECAEKMYPLYYKKYDEP